MLMPENGHMIKFIPNERKKDFSIYNMIYNLFTLLNRTIIVKMQRSLLRKKIVSR